MCFQKQPPKAVQNRCSAKTLWKSLVLVKLLYAYNSTKDKLLLKYFIKKIFGRTPLKIVIKTFFCFLWLCFKELAVTLKCCYERNSLVETTLKKCLLFRFSMRKTKYFLQSDIWKQSPGVLLWKRCLCLWKSLRKTLRWSFFSTKCQAGGLQPYLKRDLGANFFPVNVEEFSK